MAENYDPQCVQETLDRHSRSIKDAVSVDHACSMAYSLGGTGAGLAIGLLGPPGVQPVTGLAGAWVGIAVGALVCEDQSGVEEAVKPPPLTHCEVKKGPAR